MAPAQPVAPPMLRPHSPPTSKPERAPVLRPDSPMLTDSDPAPRAPSPIPPRGDSPKDVTATARPAPNKRPDSPMPFDNPDFRFAKRAAVALQSDLDVGTTPDILALEDHPMDDGVMAPRVETDFGEYSEGAPGGLHGESEETEDQYIEGDAENGLMDMSMDTVVSVQKMADALVTGPDQERAYILFQLQQLLDHCLEDTLTILLPVLCEYVPYWNVELQIKAAERLFDIVQLDIEPATANMMACSSFAVIEGAMGKASPEYDELYTLFSGILVEVVPCMKWTPQEIEDIMSLVDKHAKEPLYASRKVAARILGALSPCLDKRKVEDLILPRAIHLFEDENMEVRYVVVEGFAAIAAKLPIRVVENEVWPRVERLLEPLEDARIRATAMRTMGQILKAHRDKGQPSRLFRELLPPVFARLAAFARKYSAEDQRLVNDDIYLLLEVVSEIFGQFVSSLATFCRKSFRKEAYKAYSSMATCNGPLIRRNCAGNLPGVAQALGERYALELSGLAEYLGKDTDEEVRWILAAGMHNSVRLLVPRGNFERLFTTVCSMLQDAHPLVRKYALRNFNDLMSCFARECPDTASMRRLAPVYTKLTVLAESEWRVQRCLAEQLDKSAALIPASVLIEEVLPLLGRFSEQGTPLVRAAGMRAIAHTIRYIPSIPDRNAALHRFWGTATEGPFWMRLVLLDGAASALHRFSRQRFIELFAPKVLSLAKDSVPNVRIRLAKMLASMAPKCKGIEEYDSAVELLSRDADIDVVDVMSTHSRRAERALKEAQERTTEEQAMFREEQEYWGLAPRTAQKGVRGRLNSIRGTRILSRRPSLEESSDKLSVSKNVISAAKASSSAASSGTLTLASMPNGWSQPSAVSVSEDGPGSLSDASSFYQGEDSVGDGFGSFGNGFDGHGASDDESVGPGDNLLSTVARAAGVGTETDQTNSLIPKATTVSGNVVVRVSGGVGATMGSGARGGGSSTSVTSAAEQQQHRPQPANSSQSQDSTSGEPVTHKRGLSGWARSTDARSKSWNGRLMPRQFSSDLRGKKDGKLAANVPLNRRSRPKSSKAEGGPKRRVSSLRRKKRKDAEALEHAARADITAIQRVSAETVETLPTTSTMTSEESGAASNDVMDVTASSSVTDKIGESRDAMAEEAFDVPIVDASDVLVAEYAEPVSSQAALSLIGVGRSASTDNRRASKQHLAQEFGVTSLENGPNGDLGHDLPVAFEADSGLPSFRGVAPWSRKVGQNKVRDPLTGQTSNRVDSNADDTAIPPPVSHSVLASFHSSASRVFGIKPSTSTATAATAPAGTTSASGRGRNGVGGGGGFFRSLFRRRR